MKSLKNKFIGVFALEHHIKNIAGPRISLISGAKIVPQKLKSYLGRHTEIQKNWQKWTDGILHNRYDAAFQQARQNIFRHEHTSSQSLNFPC